MTFWKTKRAVWAQKNDDKKLGKKELSEEQKAELAEERRWKRIRRGFDMGELDSY